jgi:hypothetical protein
VSSVRRQVSLCFFRGWTRGEGEIQDIKRQEARLYPSSSPPRHCEARSNPLLTEGLCKAASALTPHHHVVARHEAIPYLQRGCVSLPQSSPLTTTSLRGTKQSHGSRGAMQGRLSPHPSPPRHCEARSNRTEAEGLCRPALYPPPRCCEAERLSTSPCTVRDCFVPRNDVMVIRIASFLAMTAL